MRTKLRGVNALYPTPTTLVGALVNGKPNFITIAHIGILNYGPGAEGARELISIGVVDIYEVTAYDVFIGEIVETYARCRALGFYDRWISRGWRRPKKNLTLKMSRRITCEPQARY